MTDAARTETWWGDGADSECQCGALGDEDHATDCAARPEAALDVERLSADPVLRLTGEQIGSITPPVEGDWFVDFDEHDEFVPKRLLDAARAETPLRAALLRMVEETYETHHTPSSESGPEEWDYTLDAPSIEAVQQAISALAATEGASDD